MEREPIRIRIIPLDPVGGQQNAREAFWQSVLRDLGKKSDTEIDAENKISYSESKLCRRLGPELRRLLVRELSESLHTVEETIFHEELSSLKYSLFSSKPQSDKVEDQRLLHDTYTRLLEKRQQYFRDNPSLRKFQEKVTVAGSVFFSVRIAGYSSLDLELSVGSLRSIAEVFDYNFDGFRVFLDAFVPEAFSNVFPGEYSDRLDFMIQVPESYSQAFIPEHSQSSATVERTTSKERERAEWLWRLANGSLVIPLLLALLVMYQGMSILQDIRESQDNALRPVLEHQLKLLEEDRRRLFKETSSPSVPSSVPTKPNNYP